MDTGINGCIIRGREKGFMKLLYVDIGSFRNHYNYNCGILRNLPANTDVDICAAKNYITKDIVHYTDYFEIPDAYIYILDEQRKFNQIYMRMIFARAYLWIRRNVSFDKYDAVFWGYTECITFYFILNGCKKRFLFADHEICSTQHSRVKKWFFTHINKHYDFIAFEDYIKDYALNQLHIKNRIWVIRHPLPQISTENLDGCVRARMLSETDGRLVLFAPAMSNSIEFIDFLVKYRSKIPRQVKIIIRSIHRTFSSASLQVYAGRLSIEEYVSAMAGCTAVLIHYGDAYNYRTSGVLYEAVRLRKPVYIYCGNTLRYYARKYPGIMFPFYSGREFFAKMDEALQFFERVRPEYFQQILNDYSDAVIQKQLEDVLSGCREV